MKKIYLSVGLLGLMTANAQKFEEVKETPFKNFYYSATAVADVDNNGFKDIVFTGAIDSDGDNSADLTHNEIYTNNAGRFSFSQNLGANAVHLSDVEFIDFDNDGLLDIVTTGLSYNDVVNYKQYRFRNTGAGFTLLENLSGKIYGGLQVFDFNHDGKMDYALNGGNNTKTGSNININFYTNTGAGFTETIDWIEGTQSGDFKIVDINNDAELDLVIFGDNDGSTFFKVYKNVNGAFVLSQELPPTNNGKMSFADFNADGFLDFVLSGQDENGELYLAVYRNDGDGNFTQNIIENEGLDEASVEVGDLNNDGYYDFAIIGNDADFKSLTKVFVYQPATDNFIKAENTNLYNLGSNGDLKIFDFDNDNHPDILINGFDWSHTDLLPFVKLYKNTSTEINENPNPPTNLRAEINDNKIIFNWSGATDDKTPAKALKYELNIGSEAGKSDIAKYTVTTPKWYLDKTNLPNEIFWSVKSIDAAGVLSENSKEEKLSTLSTVELQNQNINIFPNPVKDVLYIDTKEKIQSINLHNSIGQRLKTRLISENTIDFSSLPKGIYFVEIMTKNGNKIVKKIVKNH